MPLAPETGADGGTDKMVKVNTLVNCKSAFMLQYLHRTLLSVQMLSVSESVYIIIRII